MSRKLNVQTPGDTAPATTAEGTAQAPEVIAEGQTIAGPGLDTAPATVDNAALLAQLEALKAENEHLKAQKAATPTDIAAEDKALDASAAKVGRADRAKFLTMHSSQVDAKKLVAPVLCKDGWLAPDQSDQPRRL